MSRAKKFNARAYLLATNRWFKRWPRRAVAQLEAEGFANVRMERIVTHPVWVLRMRAPGENLTSKEAGNMIRRIVEQAGKIPRGGFCCSADRRGRIEASFVLNY